MIKFHSIHREPLENLNCPELLKKYHEQVKEKSKPPPSKKQATKKATTSQTSKKPSQSRSSSRSSESSSTYQPSTSSNRKREPLAPYYEDDDFDLEMPSTSRSSNGNCTRKERVDEIVHDQGELNGYNNKEEIFNLIEDSNSDEYETDDDDDFEHDYSASFVYPSLSTPNKIINLCSINNELYFLILFGDNKVYYIKPEVANARCRTLVLKYQAKKGIKDDAQFRKL